MKCAIYKGRKKEDHYVYIEKKDDFERIPSTLLTLVGELVFVMELELTAETKLLNAKTAEVLSRIKTSGYYLQLPHVV